MQYFVYALVLSALWFGLRYFLIFQRLGRVVLQYPRYNPVAAAAVPDFVRQLFETTGKQLQAWGFEPCLDVRVDLMVAGEQRWQQLWYCDRHQSFAWLSIPALPHPQQAVNVDFETFLADGTLLLTINGRSHYIILPMPATWVQDDYTPQLQAQWQRHAQKVEAIASQNPPKLLSPISFLELLASHEAATLAQALAQKKLKSIASDTFYLSFATAIRAAIQVGNGANREAQLSRQRPQNAVPVSIPVEAEIEAYHALNLWETRPARPQWQWGILALSGLIFGLLAVLVFDGAVVLILIGVLLFHELGHFSAMRWFGYQDTSIFFLPLLGAAASGRKDNATLVEQVLVLLAGPVPGLVVGALLLFWTGDREAGIMQLALWLVLLNFLNLLPVLPLDGGRIVDLLLFSRHPDAEILFRLFTTMVLAIAGISLQDPILLFLSLVTLLTVPSSWHSRKLLKMLPKEPTAILSKERLLEHSFQALKTCRYDRVPFSQKYRLVKEITQRYQEPPSTWLTRLTLLGLYLVCLLSGLGAIATMIWR
ncbi:MAG: hypothetical protein SAJ12_04425 [Jaaginema sp. PMC 1079.18]|nr:hypothetical protein [Jaaginema sp. PMC 1080.18]MEC4850236.1 hypothetical protein [Jaaginema sp. PMC 1079.18]MEC4867300.1 hypothetical protein [Jaaginema sp. PMC 1078.18]